MNLYVTKRKSRPETSSCPHVSRSRFGCGRLKRLAIHPVQRPGGLHAPRSRTLHFADAPVGVIRAAHVWQVHTGLNKDKKLTKKNQARISGEAFHVSNHIQFRRSQ